MTLQATSAPWMCISIVCANAFPKIAIPSESKPSGAWDTGWRWIREAKNGSTNRYPGHTRTFALERYLGWCLFPDGAALCYSRLCSPSFPGSGYQFTAWGVGICLDRRWLHLLDQFQASSQTRTNAGL